jgi:beta-glucosidase
MDMVMVPDTTSFIEDLKALVNEGTVPMSRIDDAVTRILRVKFAMGLLDPNRSQLPTAAWPRRSARPSIARWRARPCASRWCC